MTDAQKRWCARCQADVVAEGRGVCPVCKTFLPKNRVAAKNEIGGTYRDALRAALVEEFLPNSASLWLLLEELVNVSTRLDFTRAGSPPYRRMICDQLALRTALGEDRAARIRARKWREEEAAREQRQRAALEEQLIRQAAEVLAREERAEEQRERAHALADLNAVVLPPAPPPEAESPAEIFAEILDAIPEDPEAILSLIEALVLPVQDAAAAVSAPDVVPTPAPVPPAPARRDRLADDEMYESLRRAAGRPPTVRYRADDPYADLLPEDREREIAARAVRQKLGWE